MMWCLRGGGYTSRHSDQLGLPENRDLVHWRREGGVRYAYQIVIVLREIPIEFFVKIYACVELCAGVMCVRHVDVREVNVAVVSNIPQFKYILSPSLQRTGSKYFLTKRNKQSKKTETLLQRQT